MSLTSLHVTRHTNSHSACHASILHMLATFSHHAAAKPEYQLVGSRRPDRTHTRTRGWLPCLAHRRCPGRFHLQVSARESQPMGCTAPRAHRHRYRTCAHNNDTKNNNNDTPGPESNHKPRPSLRVTFFGLTIYFHSCCLRANVDGIFSHPTRARVLFWCR